VTVLVSAAELAGQLGDVVLLDVRWALGDPHGHEAYLRAHLPGAVFVDLDTELAAPPSAAEGRHPLPSVQALQSSARRWGVSSGSRVVVYDGTGGLAAPPARGVRGAGGGGGGSVGARGAGPRRRAPRDARLGTRHGRALGPPRRPAAAPRERPRR